MSPSASIPTSSSSSSPPSLPSSPSSLSSPSSPSSPGSRSSPSSTHGGFHRRRRRIQRGTCERHRRVLLSWSAQLMIVIVTAIVTIIAIVAASPVVTAVVFAAVPGCRRQRLSGCRRRSSTMSPSQWRRSFKAQGTFRQRNGDLDFVGDQASRGGPSHGGEGTRVGRAATEGASHAGEGARAGGAAAGGASHVGEGAKACDVTGAGEDDEALVNRLRQRNTQDGMEAASKLWVEDLRFWNDTEGIAIVKLTQEASLYLVAVAGGVQPPVIRRSIVLPHTTIPQHKIADESELDAAKERAVKVQGITLRVIHGWVFKSASRQRGYHAAYQYTLNHVATNIARAMWMGEDWHICMSPMVIHITLDMDMKLPLWFVGADIEDRHENDDLAAYQEASIQRLVGAFTSAVRMAAGIDGRRVLYERLKSVVDAMRIMLEATMWLMRMSGDDHRAHYDAWVFVN
ncbi:hypothetical protein CBR_g12 [Chara braunii]|uniref:Uncharacterized protein n=1 Tax=Chara braunii TaxID=69332 RepID=A0A388JLM7_CHABU|nr:hypothetical protein CBR_g12 [Chara braunii]|eukprot:GBG58612.1 hypothetical protein CBR_g12 [Chara braunii]